jgi:ABC-type transport system involved in cytochrome c biogenesis ATPase subunit
MGNLSEFTQLNTELAMQAANENMNWFRKIAEQNLQQSRAALQELVGLTRRMADDFANQASAICEHSMSLAEDYDLKHVRLWLQIDTRERTAGISAGSN